MASYVSENTGRTVAIECRYCRESEDLHTPATVLAGQWETGEFDELPRWVPVCASHFDGWWDDDMPPECRLPSFGL